MRVRSFIIAVTPSLAVVGLWFAAVALPTSRTSTELQDRLDASDAELVELASVLEDSRAANDQLVTMDRQLERLGLAVPATTDVAGFVRLMHTLAAASGAIVSAVTPQTEQASSVASGAEVTSVSISLEGDYATIMAFVDRLLTADRLVKVDSIDLAADSSAGTLFVELLVSIYSEPGSSDLVGELVSDANQQIADATAGLSLEANN